MRVIKFTKKVLKQQYKINYFYFIIKINQKSDTVTSIAETAKSGITSGYGFLYGKLFGGNEVSSSANNTNQVSSENYNRNQNSEPVQYVKMDENLNQKFLYN